MKKIIGNTIGGALMLGSSIGLGVAAEHLADEHVFSKQEQQLTNELHATQACSKDLGRLALHGKFTDYIPYSCDSFMENMSVYEPGRYNRPDTFVGFATPPEAVMNNTISELEDDINGARMFPLAIGLGVAGLTGMVSIELRRNRREFAYRPANDRYVLLTADDYEAMQTAAQVRVAPQKHEAEEQEVVDITQTGSFALTD